MKSIEKGSVKMYGSFMSVNFCRNALPTRDLQISEVHWGERMPNQSFLVCTVNLHKHCIN